MESLLDILKSDTFILFFNICVFIVLSVLITYVINMNKKYIRFMKKMGNGNNLDDMLKKYLGYSSLLISILNIIVTLIIVLLLIRTLEAKLC